MKTFTTTLTEQEINALLRLIDIAVKAQGIQVAEAGVVLFKKFNEAELVELAELVEETPAPL